MARRPAFTLLELLVALGLVAVLGLTLIALDTASLRGNQKSILLHDAENLSDSQLQKVIYQAQHDSPSGYKTAFWATEGILAPGQATVRLGATDFTYAIYANTVPGVGAPGNRLKKVDIVMWWWTPEADRVRQGYGRLTVRSTRLIGEADDG